MKVKHLFFSILALAFLSSAISKDNQIEVGDLAPRIETVDGNNILDNKELEKTKVISFWSPKKPSSRIANRIYYNSYGTLPNDTIEFISICVDSDESLTREVMKVDGITEEISIASSSISPRVFKDYGVDKNPRAFKISKEGKILEIL